MVDVSNKQNSVVIKVTSSSGNTNVAAKSDTAQYWSNVSKKYSEEAKISADQAEQAVNEVIAQKDDVISDIITNCLLEVPQRIKYEIVDGAMCILKDTVAIVPYGFEDLTSQFPKGTAFLGDTRFLVYDTQYTDGKFFVWVQCATDIQSTSNISGVSHDRFACIAVNGQTGISVPCVTSSGTSDYTATHVEARYLMDKNIVVSYQHSGDTTWEQGFYLSLPLIKGYGEKDASPFVRVDQVFNGIGYIGSTVFVDKGVKGLIPNGRNEDGSLKNIEYTFNKLATFTANSTSNFKMYIDKLGEVFFTTQVSYDKDKNLNIITSSGVDRYCCEVGSLSMQAGVISNFQPKQPFRASDNQDVVHKAGDTMTGNLTIDNANQAIITIDSDLAGLGSSPTGGKNTGSIYFKQKGVLTAIIQNIAVEDGANGLQLITRKPDNSGWGAGINIRTTADGATNITTNTPATGDNSTKIATTAFVNTLVPAGTIVSSGSSSTPTGYLYCNGAAVSRTTYAKLFSAIGTIYGTGDGSTTFNLPNFTTYGFITSATVSVKGNGKTLGLTNGTQNFGYGTFSTQYWNILSTSVFNANVGTTLQAAMPTKTASVGVTTDAAKSGITGTASRAVIKWYIKY